MLKHIQNRAKFSPNFGFIIALIAAASGAPHGIVLKDVMGMIGGNLLNALRMGEATSLGASAMGRAWPTNRPADCC